MCYASTGYMCEASDLSVIRTHGSAQPITARLDIVTAPAEYCLPIKKDRRFAPEFTVQVRPLHWPPLATSQQFLTPFLSKACVDSGTWFLLTLLVDKQIRHCPPATLASFANAAGGWAAGDSWHVRRSQSAGQGAGLPLQRDSPPQPLRPAAAAAASVPSE